MECPICLELFDNDKLIETSCGHTFCKECITKWTNEKSKQTCPLCRETLNQHIIIYINSDTEVFNSTFALLNTSCSLLCLIICIAGSIILLAFVFVLSKI